MIRYKDQYTDQYRYEYTVQEYEVQLFHQVYTKGLKKKRKFQPSPWTPCWLAPSGIPAGRQRGTREAATAAP